MSEQTPDKLVLEVDDLGVGYGERLVVAGIHLRIRLGEWCSVLGPNGSGKTTLIRAVAAQLAPGRGRIEICGYSLAHDRGPALERIGVACPPETLPGLLTGRQCLQVYAAAKGLAAIDADVLSLADALRFTRYMDNYVDTYSLGTRQKLSVLLAMLGSPALVIIDEAFNGLDPASALVLKRHLHTMVRAGRCGVLLATHAVDVAQQYSDLAVLLLNGRILRSWDRAALQAMQSQGADSLEAELVKAAEASESASS